MTTDRSHLLLVDDEPFNLEILHEYLEDGPYILHQAVDGEAAWAFLSDPNCPPLRAILLDRMMPKLDGLGVMSRMKGIDRLAQIPVILQTADAAPERVAEGIQAGAFYYLTKPFEQSVLLSVIASAVGSRTRIEEVQQRLEGGLRGAALLEHGSFAFSTPEQAQSLATLLSAACPAPEQAALGLWEMLLNAVEHGNLEISYAEKTRYLEEGRMEAEIHRRLAEEPYRSRRVVAEIRRSGQELEISITDEGPGFDWQAYLELDPTRAFHSHGRGIAMAKRLSFSSLEYRGRGNQVVLGIGG